jgi:hypothetical protein
MARFYVGPVREDRHDYEGAAESYQLAIFQTTTTRSNWQPYGWLIRDTSSRGSTSSLVEVFDHPGTLAEESDRVLGSVWLETVGSCSLGRPPADSPQVAQCLGNARHVLPQNRASGP